VLFVAVVCVAASADCNSTTEYTCDRDGRCKPLSTWCDGTPDCVDQSDERAHCRQLLSSSHQSRIFILVSFVVLPVGNCLQRLHRRASVLKMLLQLSPKIFGIFLGGQAANSGQPRKWPLNPVLCVCVCLSRDNFRKPSRRKFIFAHPVYLQTIRVKFVYEGHRVKVKVVGVKQVENHNLRSSLTPVL